MTEVRWTRLAAAWLVGVGILLVGLFAYGSVESAGADFDATDGIVVTAFSIVAALHVAAGAGIWRGHRWGAATGIVLACLGLLFCVLTLVGGEWLLLPAFVAYVGTLAILANAIGSGTR